MSVLPLVQLTKENYLSRNTSLRAPSEEVSDFGEDFQRAVEDLIETFKNHKVAVGLAAPQIGMNVKVAAINISKDKAGPTLVIVNPKIQSTSGKKDKKKEACMSIPFYQGEVERRHKVNLTYQDRYGEFQSLEAEGFLARVIFHETDHLEGMLYVDRMNDPSKLERADFFQND